MLVGLLIAVLLAVPAAIALSNLRSSVEFLWAISGQKETKETFIAGMVGVARPQPGARIDTNDTKIELTQQILSSYPKLAEVLHGFEGKYSDWYKLCKPQIEQFGRPVGSCANAMPDTEFRRITSNEFSALMSLLKPKGPLESPTGQEREINRDYSSSIAYNGTKYLVALNTAWKLPDPHPSKSFESSFYRATVIMTGVGVGILAGIAVITLWEKASQYSY